MFKFTALNTWANYELEFLRKQLCMKNKTNKLAEFLNQHPMSLSKCLALSQVHRTTFQRWLDGEANPPAATLELLRIHAMSDLATLTEQWQGWTFNHGKLWTPTNRGFEPHEVAEIPNFYRDRAILQNIQKNYALQSKLF